MSDKKIPINSVGIKIKEAREKTGLSAEELSWKINDKDIDKKKIVNWEKGREFPDLNDMYKLASYLDLNPNELLALRNQIQNEAQKEPNWALRYIINKLFNIGKPGLKFIFEIILGISIITLAANTKGLLNKMQGDQEEYDFVENVIKDDIQEFVYQNKTGLEQSKIRSNDNSNIVNEIKDNNNTNTNTNTNT